MQIEVVNYRLRPFKALALLAIGFAFGGYMLPEFIAGHNRYYARISCQQHHPLPIP